MTTPRRSRQPPPRLPIADRIRPRAAPARRYSADLAGALVVGWQRGYDFTEHFPPPHNLHEIADVIQFFIEPMLHADQDYGGPRAAAALHWLAVVRLCNYGEVTREMTDRQMHEGVWDEGLGTPCDLGSGFRPRANRDARDVLRRLGLLRFQRTSNCLVVTVIIDSVLRCGADAVVAAMKRRHGTKGFKARMEQLVAVIGKEQADLIGKEQADLIGKEQANKDTTDGYHIVETKDVTDLATPNGVAGSDGLVDGAGPPPDIPPRVLRWLAAEDYGGDLPAAKDAARRQRWRLAGASDEDVRRAYRYASEWRRRSRKRREESAFDQLVQLATAGSLASQRLGVLSFHLADRRARPRFDDPAAEVVRWLAGLHPTWVEGRINKASRAPDVENRWAYLLAALENRAEHDRWRRDRRSPAIVAAEEAEGVTPSRRDR